MSIEEPTVILPAEHLGVAELVDGTLNIGGVIVPDARMLDHVYVRRSSKDLSIMEIHIVRHDGLAQEELDEQNRQAESYPLGTKEYWRGEMVGKYRYGADQHLMTEQEFEEDWSDAEE